MDFKKVRRLAENVPNFSIHKGLDIAKLEVTP
jgi:hypothetical protein